MTNSDKWQKGLEVFDAVYGPGSSRMVQGAEDSAFVQETVNHLFADIWAAPHLSIRDKRLLVIGATTMLGRADLLEVQLAGALANDELTDEQLEEMQLLMQLLMLFYCGAGNTNALNRGIGAARKRAAEMATG